MQIFLTCVCGSSLHFTSSPNIKNVLAKRDVSANSFYITIWHWLSFIFYSHIREEWKRKVLFKLIGANKILVLVARRSRYSRPLRLFISSFFLENQPKKINNLNALMLQCKYATTATNVWILHSFYNSEDHS